MQRLPPLNFLPPAVGIFYYTSVQLKDTRIRMHNCRWLQAKLRCRYRFRRLMTVRNYLPKQKYWFLWINTRIRDRFIKKTMSRNPSQPSGYSMTNIHAIHTPFVCIYLPSASVAITMEFQFQSYLWNMSNSVFAPETGLWQGPCLEKQWFYSRNSRRRKKTK